MTTWLIIIVLSAVAGLVCAWRLSGRSGLVCSGAVPWFGVLAWLLYGEYVLPYRGGGASMWPIAQLFSGTTAAVVGIVAYLATNKLFRDIA